MRILDERVIEQDVWDFIGFDGSFMDGWRCWDSHDGNAGAIEEQLLSLSLDARGVELHHNLWVGQLLETAQQIREAESFRCSPFAQVVNDAQNHCVLFFQKFVQSTILEKRTALFREFIEWGRGHHVSDSCNGFINQSQF